MRNTLLQLAQHRTMLEELLSLVRRTVTNHRLDVDEDDILSQPIDTVEALENFCQQLTNDKDSRKKLVSRMPSTKIPLNLQHKHIEAKSSPGWIRWIFSGIGGYIWVSTKLLVYHYLPNIDAIHDSKVMPDITEQKLTF